MTNANKHSTGLLDPDMPGQEMRLHMGEITAQGMLDARATIGWANSRAAPLLEQARGALSQCDEAMGYMSEYDIPLCLPDTVKAALATINEALGRVDK